MKQKFIFCFFFKIEFVYSFSLSRCWIRNIFLRFCKLIFNLTFIIINDRHEFQLKINFRADTLVVVVVVRNGHYVRKKCLSIFLMFSPCSRMENLLKEMGTDFCSKERKKRKKIEISLLLLVKFSNKLLMDIVGHWWWWWRRPTIDNNNNNNNKQEASGQQQQQQIFDPTTTTRQSGNVKNEWMMKNNRSKKTLFSSSSSIKGDALFNFTLWSLPNEKFKFKKFKWKDKNMSWLTFE